MKVFSEQQGSFEEWLQNIKTGEFFDLLCAANEGEEELYRAVGAVFPEQADGIIAHYGGIEGFKARLDQIITEFAEPIIAAIKEATPGIIKMAESGLEAAEVIAAQFDKIHYIEAQLEANLKAAAAENKALEQFTAHEIMRRYYSITGEISPKTPDELRPILERSIAAWAKRFNVQPQPVNKVDFPLDKVNGEVWSLFEQPGKNGQIKMGFDTTPQGMQRKTIVYYSIDFDEMEGVTITRKLTAFDKRVQMAVAALYNAGNAIVSITQIYRAMGGKGNPSSSTITKVDASLTKMSRARIFIDNAEEVNAGLKYPKCRYDGPLLNIDRVTGYSINGKVCESSIRIFIEPALIAFARARRQITTIDRRLLESPLNLTESQIALEDYFIERISHMKKGKARAKMLYETIFSKCGIAEKKQKQRAPGIIKRILDFYTKEGFIAGFREDKDGVTIRLQPDAE